MATALLIVAAALYAAILSLWVVRHIRLSQAHGDFLQPERPPADWRDQPSVTVLVPAHNEQDNLPACLGAILASEYSNLSVLVVDDRSTDRTAEVAAACAARDGRVRVHRIERVAEGVEAGKANALRTGAATCTSEWLLFVDADVRLGRDAVASAVYTAGRRGAEMISLWPALHNVGFAEKLLNPICAGVLQIWCPYEKVSDPNSKTAFASGQFVLIRREAYEAVGGHPRGAWMEDVALARHVKDSGRRIWMGVGERRSRVRMYKGFRQIVRGWSRIFVGSLVPAWKLVLSLLGALSGSVMPMVLIVWLGLGRLAGWGVPDSPWVTLFFWLAVVHLTAVVAANWRLGTLMATEKWPLWFYPLAVAGLIWILIRAIHIRFFGGHIQWGGRRYRAQEAGSEKPAAPA